MSEPLSVTWPLDGAAYAKSATHTHVIGETSIANSLHHSVRAIVAGKPSLHPFGGERGGELVGET